VPRGCGGYPLRFWIDQPYASKPPLLIDALNRVSVQFKLADDGRWEVNPASAQLVKCDRVLASLAQALQHLLLLSVGQCH
jgi:hypothetical protein